MYAISGNIQNTLTLSGILTNLSNIALMYHGGQIFIEIGEDMMEIWCSVIL